MLVKFALRGRRGRRWAFDLSSVPAESTRTAGKFFGFFLIVFALLWVGFPAAMLIRELGAGRGGPELLIILPFPVIGIGILLFSTLR